MKNIAELIHQLESRISEHALHNPDISNGSVGWHIEHSLLTLNIIIEALKKSEPSNFNSKFDFRRLIVLTVGKIPRGKIKAPKLVQPSTVIDPPALLQHLLLTKENLKALDSLSKGHFFSHPFLGDFRLKQAVKFLCVHTNHHLSIINDIINSRKAG